MTRLTTALLLALSLASTASAMTFSLPSLDFPDTATVVSTQNCTIAQDPANLCK